MTNVEFLQAVVDGNVNDEVVAYAAAQIEKVHKANEKRRNTPSKTAIANAPIIEALTDALTAEAQTAADLAAKVSISTQKASALLRQMVANGVAHSDSVKVPGKGEQKVYSLA